jgi:ketosteroid isomerase-like protein
MAKAKKRSATKKRSPKKTARAKKSAKRAPAKKKRVAKKAAPKKAAASGIESVARKIVRMSQAGSFGPAEIRALYNADATSIEASGASATGHAALDEKMKGWEQMTASMVLKARNVWTRGNTVCIEWDSTVTMRDGRTVQLEEIAIHEIKQGKIQNERYYYNPMVLAPPQQALPGV